MTGFGLAIADFNGAKITVEIKSLNSKFLDLTLKIPRAYFDKELSLRNLCAKEIERGKVSVALLIERNENTQKAAVINKNLLKQYYKQLEEIKTELGSTGDNLFQLALTFPEVINSAEETANEAEWRALNETFNNALANFNQFRANEGTMLKADLLLRINNIMVLFKEIDLLEPQRMIQIKTRLQQFLGDAVSKICVDQNRLEQELIYYIEKLDITEEKIRLKSHCSYFISVLNSNEGNGKKLNFISQEIGREINTMGAKANDAKIQQLVVCMKEELEKIKEQLLNIL